MSYNIRSYCANSDSFFCFFDQGNLPEFLIFTETWFTEFNIKNIPGYLAYHTIRKEGRSGGVSIYVRDTISSFKVEEISLSDVSIELCSVKISLNGDAWYLLGIYRPHSDTIQNFQLSLDSVLNSPLLHNKNCIILGDFNINLLSNDLNVQNFITNMHSYHFIPVITKPTRFPDNSSNPSLIDHIWLNKSCSYSSGIILCDVTDHTPTYIRLPNLNYSTSETEKIRISFRPVTEEGKVTFERVLADFCWNDLKSDNVNLFFDSFSKALNDLYCKSFPIKVKYITAKQLSNPWITSRIRQLIKIKSNYFQSFKMGVITKSENNSFKNKVKCLIDKTKVSYYKNVFQSNKNDIKKTWTTIRSLISKNYKQNTSIKKIIHENIEFINSDEISHIFNEYYSTVAHDLENDLPQNTLDPISYVTTNPHSMFLSPVTESECNKLIMNLKISKQPINFIPVKILKEFSSFIAPTLCDIMNKSFSSGIFPNALKRALVVPVFKGGKPHEIKIFPPISVLPVLSTVFERSIYNRIYSFIQKFSILSNFQHGFLKGLSTQSAVNSLTEYLYDTLDSKEIAINIFIDFRKAFDTVQHCILLRKLESYGIRGLPLLLIRNYLSDRVQAVRVGDSLSSFRTISVGVPQGSILGPILFLLYINDLPNFSNSVSPILYADDTTLSFRNKSATDVVDSCNRELIEFSRWATCNRLSINTEKTVAMIVSNFNLSNQNFTISLNDSILDLNQSCKFLGLVLDKNLKFNCHIKLVCSKISKSIGILYSLRQYLSKPALISLYYSLIYPYLIYCNLSWGNTYQSHLNPLLILQKKAIRIINNVPFSAHTNDLFFSNGILKLADINKFQQSVFMYKSNRTNFSRNHSYNTRTRNTLNPIFCRTSIFQHSLSFSAPNVWNEIPNRIKFLPSLSSFKYHLKQHFLSSYSAFQ